jgi:alkylhydroperoxidase/carboxymuconolactone decarboxylase family protein YurZ
MSHASTLENDTAIDSKLHFLISAAAAAAANWEAGLRNAVLELARASVDGRQILGAVKVAEAIKARPAAQMKEVADVLTGTRLEQESAPSRCGAAHMPRDEQFTRTMLIAAGAAMAAGCEPCLNKVVPELIENGVSEIDIRHAVLLGQHAKDGAAASILSVIDCFVPPNLATATEHGTRARSQCGCTGDR